MRDRIDGVGDLDFVADFADDGVDGGDCDKVLRVLRGEIAIGSEYGSRNNFERMCVYPWAGDAFAGDVTGFQQLGIKVEWSGNVKFMQVPIAWGR